MSFWKERDKTRMRRLLLPVGEWEVLDAFGAGGEPVSFTVRADEVVKVSVALHVRPSQLSGWNREGRFQLPEELRGVKVSFSDLRIRRADWPRRGADRDENDGWLGPRPMGLRNVDIVPTRDGWVRVGGLPDAGRWTMRVWLNEERADGDKSKRVSRRVEFDVDGDALSVGQMESLGTGRVVEVDD